MKNKTLRPYPFSFLVVLNSILIIIAIVIVLVLSALVNREVKGVLGDMSERVLVSKSEQITHRIEMYLNQPRHTNQFLSRLLEVSESASPVFIRQALLHLMEKGMAGGQPIPQVGYVSASGDYVAFSRNQRGNPFLIRTRFQGSTQLIVYKGISEDSGIARILPDYNLLTRTGYIQARQHTQSFWTTTYTHLSDNSGPVMSYHTPVRGQDDRFRGMIISGIHPTMMRTFLQTLKPFPGSTLMILNNKGEIVSSTDENYLADLSAMTSTLPSIKSYSGLADILAITDWVHSDLTSPVSIDLDKGRFYFLSRILHDQDNRINWHLVIVTPRNISETLLTHYKLMTIMVFSGVIFLAFLLVISLLVRFNHPLKAIIRKAASLGKEPWENESRIRLFPEIARLDSELARTSVLISESLAAQQRLAEEDPDTGLPNYAGLCRQIANGKTHNMLALINLNNFTVINMILGKTFAMEIASKFINDLRGRLPPGTILARVRMHKFVIVFSGVMQSHQIELYEKWLGTIFLDSHSADGKQNQLLEGNIGTVIEEITKERLLPILLSASIAAHAAVSKGNGEVVRFTAEMHEDALENFRLHEHLRGAIANDEFHLVMQPIVDLGATNLCTEGECLIRWQSNELGFVSPDKFIAIAEQTGLIVPIGRWVIETACRELSDFIQRGAPKDFKLHINISAIQLKNRDFSSHLLGCITRHHLRPENICIELTERVLVDDSGKALKLLSALRCKGVTVALDDFGSGYSSLSYLHLLPFDCLKIDKNFVKDILNSKKSEAMILSVLGIAQNFHVPLVAEGVDTAEIGAKLHDLGCEKAQGYFYGRPSRFEEWPVANGELALRN